MSFTKIRGVLGCALLTWVLYFSSFFSFFTPVPLFILSLKENPKQWWLSLWTILGCGVFYFWYVSRSVTEQNWHYLYFLEGIILLIYLLIGVVLSISSWRKWSLTQLGTVSGLGILGVVVGIFLLAHTIGWIHLPLLKENVIADFAALLDQIARSPSAETRLQETLLVIEQVKARLIWIPRLSPAILFDFVLFVCAINVTLTRWMTIKTKPFRLYAEYHCLKVPFVCVWLMITAGALFFLDVDVLKVGWLKIVALNIWLGVVFIYFIQGLSITSFFFKRFSLLFRFGIYGLVLLFFQIASLLLALIGIADHWLDFRKLEKQRKV